MRPAALDLNPTTDYIPGIPPSVTEGCLISVSRCWGGERWPEGSVGDAALSFPAGGPSRIVLARQPRAEGP